MYRRAELSCAPSVNSPHAFDKLPTEMWRYILEYCDITSAARMRAVCTRTQALAEMAVPEVIHFVGADKREVREKAENNLVPLRIL